MTDQPVDFQKLADVLVPTAIRAGQKIMEIYAQDFEVVFKDDTSPVTVADEAAEKIILADLAPLTPEIPVVAEESAAAGNIPDVDNRFWLVDPLDGTKEFIKKGSDFTVNIALVENRLPVFGIVYAPALGKLYLAKSAGEALIMDVSDDGVTSNATPITVRDVPEDGIVGVASKSHRDDATNDFLDRYGITDTKSIGSSLKFCLVASAEADIYPRFGPTMEWDTGAGHAVLRAAGGDVVNPDGSPFLYGKVDFRNGPFIANGKVEL
ncbi:3'(2'),5'-bisphosphate nucleotidase CysQ [Emcibacter sp.]|uniref:3'(2'),5'-bisphosphate nucleotidase CysQ n=1 Tax=Emcibacter sp. TaxID=1979954 RepID=UPI002AA7E193|nr:3'(2'),5'-bisphosphate nucleotidase CysQ [Emcibacter sp.]